MLSSAEIKKLYEHVKKQKVKHVDIQLEIVDHLASEIELMQKEKPDMQFNNALTEASRKFKRTIFYTGKDFFGRTHSESGFKGFIVQKVFTSSKYLNKRMIDYFISFFKLPKVMITISIWLTLYKLLEIGHYKNIVILVFTFQILAMVYCYIKTFLFQRVHGWFMSYNHPLLNVMLLPLFSCYYIVQFIRWLDTSTFYFPIIVSAIFTVFILSAYIGLFYFTNLIHSEIKEKYGNHNLKIV